MCGMGRACVGEEEEERERERGGRTTPSQLVVPKRGHFGIGLDWKIGGGVLANWARHKSIKIKKKKKSWDFFSFFGEASNAALVFDSLEHHVVSGHREKVRGNVGAAL